MKYFKKLAGVLLALVMVMALAAPAFASGANPGKITLKNPDGALEEETHTYNVYRVFDMSLGGSEGDENRPVTYTASTALKEAIESDNDVRGYFTFSATNVSDVFTVTPTDDYDTEAAAKAFSAWLGTRTNLLTKVGDPVTLTGEGEINLEVPYGYYFVDSNVGSLFMLNSTTPDVEIKDKNVAPTVEKEVDSLADNVKIGDVIDYKITINVVEGSKAYTLHDEMKTGLELVKDSMAVKVDGKDVDTKNYTFKDKATGVTDDCTFEIDFTEDYLKSIPGKEIIVTYQATILDTAAIPPNAQVIQLENDAKVSFGGENETEPSTSIVELYQFDLVKTDSGNKLLDGAEFELYSGDDVEIGTDANGSKTCTLKENVSPIKFVYDEASETYKVNTTDEANAKITVYGGKVTVQGLKGTYYLKETKAPSGYNEVTDLIEVDVNTSNSTATLNGDTYASGGVQVINQTGTELPSTGGIGTTIFYIVGGVLVVGAVVLLITKRRAGVDEE